MTRMPEEVQAAIGEQRPWILVTVTGLQIEVLFGGDPQCPPTWADVGKLLAYAAQCAQENASAEEDRWSTTQRGPATTRG